jgi:hypothetical protein
MANPPSPGSELQKLTRYILQIVRSANGAADTVLPTLFGLSSQETQVGPKLSDTGSGQKRKFAIQRNFGKTLFLRFKISKPFDSHERWPGL